MTHKTETESEPYMLYMVLRKRWYFAAHRII